MSRVKALKEPGSAITHFIGLVFAVIVTIPLLTKASRTPGTAVWAFAIYAVSTIMLYLASTTYHSFNLTETVNTIFKKIDHMMIFVLIAGTYTPFCIQVIGGKEGYTLTAVIWAIAATGMIIKMFFVFCPKWVSSVLYIGMGWICVFFLKTLIARMSAPAFAWLFAGGVVYTIGGIIYSMKMPGFNERHPNFGTHEIFHLFVMAGSLCHFIALYCFVL